MKKGKKMGIYIIVGVAAVAAVGVTAAALKIRSKAGFTYNDFLEELEKRIDGVKAENKKPFEGGKCSVSRSGKYVEVNADLFYNENDKWNKQNVSYTVPISHFSNESETQEQLNKLKTAPMQFDIT